MADERMESIEQGIAAPDESEKGRRAEEQRRNELARSPARSDSAMGGTSDAGTAGDEAQENADLNAEASEEERQRIRSEFGD